MQHVWSKGGDEMSGFSTMSPDLPFISLTSSKIICLYSSYEFSKPINRCLFAQNDHRRRLRQLSTTIIIVDWIIDIFININRPKCWKNEANLVFSKSSPLRGVKGGRFSPLEVQQLDMHCTDRQTMDKEILMWNFALLAPLKSRYLVKGFITRNTHV